MIALYVKTHRKTGLKYLGITIQNPFVYKGSGIRWSNHIDKHGNDVDTEVIRWCDGNAAVRYWGIYYSDLWNVVTDPGWANLKREEGDGGFNHINSVPKHERKNIVTFKERVANGEITPGGTSNWSEESWSKVRETSWGNRDDIPSPWARPEEDILKTIEKMSESAKGVNNSQYGTHIYIDSTYQGNLPPTSVLNKNRFREGDQPVGWITLSEWRDRRKNKSNSAYGRKWYNDGDKNYYLYPNDIKIEEMRLVHKRLKINGCCGSR